MRQLWHLGLTEVRWDDRDLILEAAVGEDSAVMRVYAGGCNYRTRLVVGSANPDDVLGWQSLYYGHKTAMPTVEVLLPQADLPIRLVTVLQLGQEAPEVSVADDLRSIICNGHRGNWTIEMLAPGEKEDIVAHLRQGNSQYL